jgi:uncharacterized membrane protein HdeD (DUF308 family)
MSQISPAPSAAAQDADLRLLRWLPIVHGGITIIFGALLLFTPGRTLTFVATVAGISFLLVALVDLVRALGYGLARQERLARLGLALLAAVAGIVVIVRPEGSIKTIAVVAGIYLILMGVTALMLRPASTGGLAKLRGGLAIVAGTALVVWPDVTVGVVAAVYGAFLLAIGAAEVYVGVRLRHVDDPA